MRRGRAQDPSTRRADEQVRHDEWIPSRPTVGFETSPQAATSAHFDETWAGAGELDVLVAAG